MARMYCGVVAFLLTILLLGGCGGGGKDDKKPTTVPASGKVVDRAGKPLPQGTIHFVPTKDPELKQAALISGEIKSGEFTLNTNHGKEKLSGAPEGEYEVTIQTDSKGAIPPVTLATKYIIKSGESLTVKLEK